jgi:hypothetical protein
MAEFGQGEREQHVIRQGRNQPAVFMFQPTHYEVVTGERLDEWEDYLAERVGLRGVSTQGMGASISFCPGLDDCDQVQM